MLHIVIAVNFTTEFAASCFSAIFLLCIVASRFRRVAFDELILDLIVEVVLSCDQGCKKFFVFKYIDKKRIYYIYF